MRSRAAKDARVLAKDPEEDNCRLENDVEASRAATRGDDKYYFDDGYENGAMEDFGKRKWSFFFGFAVALVMVSLMRYVNSNNNAMTKKGNEPSSMRYLHQNVKRAYDAHKKALREYAIAYQAAYRAAYREGARTSSPVEEEEREEEEKTTITKNNEQGEEEKVTITKNNEQGEEEKVEELAKTFTVGVFASHANPQVCVTLKSAIMNGLDVHLLGFNASGFKSSGQIDRAETYKDWYCNLPTNRLTAGGAGFESILQEDASAKNFVRRWRLRNQDIEERGDFKNDSSSFDSFDYTFSATDTVWPFGMEKLYQGQSDNAYKGEGYMDKGVMERSTTRYVSTGAWMGKSQSLCKLFTKMAQIKHETIETAKQMPGGTLHLQAQVKMAISAMSGTPQMKANTVDYDKRIFFSGGTGNPCKMLQVDKRKGNIEIVDDLSPNVTSKPLWVAFVARCQEDIRSLWFMKMTKADFRKRTGKTEALVKLHSFHQQNISSESPDDVKKIEELCPYAWDSKHNWAKALGWWKWGPTEFGEVSDVQS